MDLYKFVFRYMCLLSTGAWLNGKYELAIFIAAFSTFISWPFYVLIAVPLAIDILFVRKQYLKFIKWSAFSTFVIAVIISRIFHSIFI